MRRLPIFFIIDVSGNIDSEVSSTFIEQTIKGMKNDPFLLDTGCLTVITFSSDVSIETEYIDLYEIENIEFKMRSCISITQEAINNVFTTLKDIYAKNVQETTADKKGDNCPIIIWVSNLYNCLDKDNPLLLEYRLMFSASIGFSTTNKEELLLDVSTLKHWEIDNSKQFFIQTYNLWPGEDEIRQTENSVHFLRRGYKLVYNKSERL